MLEISDAKYSGRVADMHTTVIQLYSAAAQDAAASVDVPDDGVLLGMHLMVKGALNADGEEVAAEVSFGSVGARTSNDARQVIGVINEQIGLLGAAGGASTVGNVVYDFGDGIQVFAGERIYLHTSVTGGAFGSARALLIMGFKAFQARRR